MTYKKYTIHDNGGRPFVVYDAKTKVIVYKQIYEYSGDEYKLIKSEKLFEIPYEKIFVGSKFDGNKYLQNGTYIKGNSILLKLKNTKYMYIGHEIYTFDVEKDDEIIKYYSPNGNSDVPYPYAISQKYTYLMIEYVYLPNYIITIPAVYSFYYGQIDGDGNRTNGIRMRNNKHREIKKKYAKKMKTKTIVKRQ